MRTSNPSPKSDIDVYFRDVARYAKLSAAQERNLAQRFHEARHACLRRMLGDHNVQRECCQSIWEVQQAHRRIDSVIEVAITDTAQTNDARDLIEATLSKLTVPAQSPDALPEFKPHEEAAVDLLASLNLRWAFVRLCWETVGGTCDQIQTLQTESSLLHRKLVRHNLRLVASIATRYQSADTSLLDLIQDGNIGLVIAAEKFEPRRGFRFSTYATWWIREMIHRGIRSNGRTIRITTSGREFQQRVEGQLAKLRQELGYLNCEQVDRQLGLSREDRWALRAMRPIVSLDYAMADDVPAVSLHRDHQVAPPLVQVERADLICNAMKSLASYKHRDKEVIRMRFGLDGHEEHTYDRIAETLSMSRQGVTKIAKRVLSSLATQLDAASDVG